jgi:hypothetical protein
LTEQPPISHSDQSPLHNEWRLRTEEDKNSVIHSM